MFFSESILINSLLLISVVIIFGLLISLLNRSENKSLVLDLLISLLTFFSVLISWYLFKVIMLALDIGILYENFLNHSENGVVSFTIILVLIFSTLYVKFIHRLDFKKAFIISIPSNFILWI